MGQECRKERRMNKALLQVLEETEDAVITLKGGAKQVFITNKTVRAYYELSDYIVSSMVSGPSLILVKRKEQTNE